MKVTALVCVFLLLLCLSAMISADGISPISKDECEKYATLRCTREYNPVCGDDGKTYSTECILCMENKNRNQKVKVMHKGNVKFLKPTTQRNSSALQYGDLFTIYQS